MLHESVPESFLLLLDLVRCRIDVAIRIKSSMVQRYGCAGALLYRLRGACCPILITYEQVHALMLFMPACQSPLG